MANYYFWADTDNDWECGAGDNWRDAANGGGNPYTGGAQQPPAGSDIHIEKDCTTNADHSATVFQLLEIEAGDTLTIANGGDIRFGTDKGEIQGTLHLDTGGSIRFTDVNVDVDGALEFDGGTFYLYETLNAYKNLSLYGTCTGTANGGKIALNGAYFNRAGIVLGDGKIIEGNIANRIEIDGTDGANAGYLALYSRTRVANADLHSLGNIGGTGSKVSMQYVNCLVHGSNGLSCRTGSGIFLRDSFIYGCTRGVYSDSGDSIYLEAVNCVFGETEGAVGDANANEDIGGGIVGFLYNCKLSSGTPVDSNPFLYLCSTAHDQDEDDWRQWRGIGHLAQPEFGAGAQGGAGAAVKCVSGANTADNDYARFRRLVATIPIDSASDTKIDATLYIKGTNTKTAVLRIDPDGIFGTTQAYNETADGNWNQRTIPQYTLSGAGIGKVYVPIYLDITGASETWYYDTLDYTLS